MPSPLSAARAPGLAALLLVLSAAALPAQRLDSAAVTALRARAIGPAGMSGRVAAIDAVVRDPSTIYVGAATGGLWKSTDGGVTWAPIFDAQNASSIGAIAIYQPNPDVVWVGTGEGNVRNSMGVGRGVYKSVDGGRSWRHMGLERSERIHRVLTHPSDPDVAYVAALGPAWSEGGERGVYKTTDGGESWTRVLHVDDRTGAAELVMDPRNPDKLFAATWEYRRWPWFFRSGGAGSGLHVTHDGGRSWARLGKEDGLPAGELGRIGVAVARSNPDVVYALVEADTNQLLRSDDGGRRWRSVNRSPEVGDRPFYYQDLRVDPQNENRVYHVASTVRRSEDGGRTFQEFVGWKVHPDHHAFWIHPENPELILDGNDGGVYISRDRGGSWRFVENLPLAQFYHINVDMETPFNVYGGLQDNGSWRGPSRVWENGGIRNHHWQEVGFGDGFATLVDPSDPQAGYSMSQGGSLMRFDRRTGERKSIRPPEPEGGKLRFNWNSAIATDPFDPRVVYYGSQFVHRSPDRGDSWEIISPDLTSDDPEKQRQAESGGLTLDVTAAENHTTILSIAPSALERGVIWAGTDDGRLHLTRDGGASWTEVGRNLRGVPAGTWIPHVEASKFDPAEAFVVLDNHRRGDWTPYVYRTTDYGRSWRSIATPEIDGFAHVLEQDPVEPRLLFLGTEFGMWVSTDAGAHWRKWTGGLPTAPVLGLIVHPRDHDLVIGTHGRAAYLLDDVRPLREIAARPGRLREPLHLYEVPPAIAYVNRQVDGSRFPADAMWRGENRPYGALLSYSLGGPAGDSARATIEVLDARGAVVRTFQGPAKPGINRVAWNLRRDGFRQPPSDRAEEIPEEFRPQGPPALPGRYTVRVRVGEHASEQPVEVLPDPREQVAPADRQAKLEALMRMGAMQERAVDALEKLKATERAVEVTMEALRGRDDDASRALREEGERIRERADELWSSLAGPRNAKGIVDDGDAALNRVQGAYGMLASSGGAPTPAQLVHARQAEAALEAALPAVTRFLADEVAPYRARVEAAGLGLWPDR